MGEELAEEGVNTNPTLNAFTRNENSNTRRNELKKSVYKRCKYSMCPHMDRRRLTTIINGFTRNENSKTRRNELNTVI